ncbi:hypothetical protein MalM25_35430 [Planctomycetes bacterium MalM25]|nr:hypothetical protein MalM25_35430 [Planctomycetes bacterium MalM25]
MIRRDWPRGAEPAERWYLISQVEHARLSHQLAAAWTPSFLPSHVREEFLAAVLHHDDGWLGWDAEPLIDPEHGRPSAFTEMPPAEAQRIWSDSIDACRAIGPLAGWVVASHFTELQSKPDEDYAEWVDWLELVRERRDAWLAEWLDASEQNTPELADRCLAWLQALDWLSLWLCCLCPAEKEDQPIEPLVIGGEANPRLAWTAVTFTPHVRGGMRVTPWPFVEPCLDIRIDASVAPAEPGDAKGLAAAREPAELTWLLKP